VTGQVSLVGVSKTFGSGSGQVQALGPIDLDLRGGEITSVLGVSGCGKSTLLHIIAGIEEPSTGHVAVDGTRIEGPGRDRGMVFQSYTLFPWLTAQGNVEFALKDLPLTGRQRRDRAMEYLSLVGVADFHRTYPAQLSGGMRQRVAIARALCYQPRVLLMDEPFGALDAITRQEMQFLLLDVWDRYRITILFVTHDIEEAVLLSDRVILLADRPGTVEHDRNIDIGRPRDVNVVTSTELAAHKGDLLACLRKQGAEIGRPPFDRGRRR
jgi:NitT/TauT family transport system ATP-binding protein